MKDGQLTVAKPTGRRTMNFRNLLSPPPISINAVLVVAMVGLAVLASASTSQAQLTTRRVMSATDDKVASLDEQLINQLRATTEDRKAFIRMVVLLVDQERFEKGHLIAIQRYAMRRNPDFPFPYFERAMRFEAEKVGITLPPVQLLAGSKSIQVR